MKNIHEKKMLKQEEEYIKEQKRLEDKQLENKRRNEKERQKIEQDFLIDKININKNFLEEKKRLEGSHNIMMDYIEGIYQNNINLINNNYNYVN